MAVSASITPEIVCEALRSGWVVVPSSGRLWTKATAIRYGPGVADGQIAVLPSGSVPGYGFTWWCPDPRFVIPAAEAKVNKKLRALLRRSGWHSTVNAAFRDVVIECRRDREPCWITDDYLTVLMDLHHDGWAYSVEIWEGDELVGGGFGLALGGVASIDSHFFRRSGASKVCLAEAAGRAAAAGARWLDLQWPTAHGADVGGRAVPAAAVRAAAASGGRLPLPTDRRPTTWLLP